MSPEWRRPESWKRNWVLGGIAAAILAVVLVAATVALTNDEAQSSDRPDGPPDLAALGSSGVAGPVFSEELEACLSDQGVEVPEPGSAPDTDGTSEEMQKAFEACREYLPEMPEMGAGAPGMGEGAMPPGAPAYPGG